LVKLILANINFKNKKNMTSLDQKEQKEQELNLILNDEVRDAVLNVRLSSLMKKEILALSKQRDASVSSLIRNYIREGFKMDKVRQKHNSTLVVTFDDLQHPSPYESSSMLSIDKEK
jgi:hypothetical protein